MEYGIVQVLTSKIIYLNLFRDQKKFFPSVRRRRNFPSLRRRRNFPSLRRRLNFPSLRRRLNCKR